MAEKPYAAEVRDKPFGEALSERFLSYALSTIVSRSLPDARDGLKPVHRRLLHAMRELRLGPDSSPKKSARVVGDVIGRFHPHGDVAVYDAMVRLAQGFSLRYPLIQGQGNFGDVDGSPAAAMRYTEARLTPVAQRLLEAIDQDTVDFRETYDGADREPVVLPANFPNLLANGAMGIAVGMATDIPPHNVAELCNAMLHLIKHPEASAAKLTEFVPGPDFPTGGVLVESRESIAEAYATGRGGFRLRARWEVEKLKGGAYQIVVTEMPYQVQKAKLVERIADLLNERKLTLLADVRDESAEDIRLVLEPKSRNVDPAVLMETLFQHTDLETRIKLNLNVLDVDNTPRVMSLREALQSYLDHRHVVLKRRTGHRLGEIARRLEIVAGYLTIHANVDEAVKIIREADAPRDALMSRWELTETQADAILNMRLRALNKLQEITLRDELTGLEEEQADLTGLMADETRRWGAIGDEIRALRKEFGPRTEFGARRAEIADAPAAVAIPVEATIEREPVTVLLSKLGWIRAARGHLTDFTDVKYKEGDGHRLALHAQTTDKLLLFASNGRFYTLGVEKLPRGRGQGEPLNLSIDLTADDTIVAMMLRGAGEAAGGVSGGEAESQAAKGEEGRRFLIASDDGRGFVVVEANVIGQTRAGRQVLNLAKDARAVACLAVSGDAVAVVGSNRRLLVFDRDEIPVMTRGRGVILQRYKTGGLVPEILSDIKTFTRADGLSWPVGERKRTEKDLTPWSGPRGAAGKVAPKGFPRGNKFG